MNVTTDGTHYMPDYIPTKRVAEMYEPGDWRKGVYLSDPAVDVVQYDKINYPGVVFLKRWPRTDHLYGKGSYRHVPRLARLAEVYLIAAEAGKDLAILNELRTKRGATALAAWSDEELQNEWVREMIGEGMRIECLKRWNIGYNGRPPQEELIIFDAPQSEFSGKVCPAGYYRFILPIPSHEIDNNENMVQTPEWLTVD